MVDISGNSLFQLSSKTRLHFLKKAHDNQHIRLWPTLVRWPTYGWNLDQKPHYMFCISQGLRWPL